MALHPLTDSRSEADKAAQRAKAQAVNDAACAKALDEVAWMLDFYGYQDDDVVGVEFMDSLMALFRQGAWLSKRARPFAVCCQQDHATLTAGQLREAAR